MTETTRAELVADLRALGVSNRHAMYHCSMKALGAVEGGPQGVIDAMVEAAGDGVVLLPAFDYESFSERGYFDRKNSKSRMGLITEVGRTDLRFERTPHPMISFSVWGAERDTRRLGDEYLDDVPNGHGVGSVFHKFAENNGVIVIFNTEGFRPNDVGATFVIHAAVLAEAPWRTMKNFTGTYVDGGFPRIRTYSASVTKDPTKHVTEVSPGHEEAERLGVITRHKFGRATCLRAEAKVFLEFAVESHRKSPGLWRREI